MELWIRSGPHRLDISDDQSYRPDVLDDWLDAAVKAIITLNLAYRTDTSELPATPDGA